MPFLAWADFNLFCFAVFGGLAVNLLTLLELRHLPRIERPDTFRDPLYTLHFFIVPLCGGVLCLAYVAGGTVSPLLAINVGASAPLILKSFAAVIPPTGRRIG